jgi:hypothetical protein
VSERAREAAIRSGLLVLVVLLAVLGIYVAAGDGLRATATPDFTIRASPASQSARQGQPVGYTITVATTSGLTGPVTLVASGLPPGVTAAFDPSAPALTTSVTSATSTLTLSTSASTPVGSYTVAVTGASGHAKHSVTVGLTRAQLVADSKLAGKRFGISGGPSTPLAPGVPAQPIDLTITNPNHQPLSVTDISVTVSGTSRAGCTAADFAVTQYSGPYPLTVPRQSSSTLSRLGVAASAMPTVRMLDLARNQDACKSATVSLSYSGSAEGK